MIEDVIKGLNNNEVGIIPTETVLGLCTNFDNEIGIQRIYDLKKRPRDKKLSVVFENFAQITNNFDISLPREFKKLAFSFWPGPLTVVISDNNGEKIGFRKPKHEIALYILSKLDKPLVCTSVNESGKRPAENVSEISKNISNNVDFIVDCDADKSRSSTVYDLTTGEILRKGPISLEQINKVLND